MTAIANPTSQALLEWTKIFPKQVTENYTSSVTFMKQLTVIAVSTITYLKNALPEESYTSDNFGGVKLRVLKKKCRDELAQFLSTALTQAFEAFDLKYLHQLALCFYEGEYKLENLVEYHVFEYSYSSEAAVMSVRSKTRNKAGQTTKFTFENVREQTVQLIRACVVVLQTCQYDLPENYDVSLRLYYNKDAPEGYQAPGFMTSMESEDHLEPTASEAIKLGSVETPYHCLTTRSYIRSNVGASHEAIASQNPPMMSQMEQEFNETVTKDRSVSESSEPTLRCPCNKGGVGGDADAEAEPLLTCYYCQTQQHAVCFGLMPEEAGAVARHCCPQCSDQDPSRVPTDHRLVPLSRNKRECMCVFRRTLWVCLRAGRVCARDLASALGVSDTNAARLMRLLHSYGIVHHSGDRDLITAQKVSMDNLKSIMSKFFRVSEEQDMVDRLLAETFASQESQPDPVGDVLDPLEKVSLQSASNPGRVIEQNINDYNLGVEDPTLKQYKEALLSNYRVDEDLPLSGSYDPIKDITNEVNKRVSKRKINVNNDENKTMLRTGVKTKRAKTERAHK